MNIHPILSGEVYRSEEFQALCKLLGIDWNKATLAVTIQLGPDPDDLVTVTHSYRANLVTVTHSYRATHPERVETTTQHNQNLRTFLPKENKRLEEVLIVDDPVTPKEALSADEHAATLEWFKGIKK